MATPVVRAKFTVAEVTRFAWNDSSTRIVLTPVYDPSNAEDMSFAKATPIGRLEMQVDNPRAAEKLVLGTTFYLDFTPVEAPVSA